MAQIPNAELKRDISLERLSFSPFGEAAEYYQRAVGHPANPLPGENRAQSKYDFNPETGQQYPGSWDQNVIGFNEKLKGVWYSPANFFKQGGLLTRALNLQRGQARFMLC